MKTRTKLAALAAAILALSLIVVPQAQASYTVTITVSASNPSGTAIIVYAKEFITITATGSATYGYEGTTPCVGYPVTDPDGSRYLGSTNCGPKYDPNATLHGAAVGLLIARIAGTPWLDVGASNSYCVNSYGSLELAYNDSVYSDNTGSYTVVIKGITDDC